MSQDVTHFDTTAPADPSPPESSPSPKEPEHRSSAGSASKLPRVNLAILIASLLLLGFLIYEQHQASTAVKSVQETSKDATKAEDEMKPKVDRLNGQVEDLARKVENLPSPPNYGPRIESLSLQVVNLGKSQAEVNDRINDLGKKLDGLGKGEGLASSPRFEAMEKQVGDIAKALEVVKVQLASLSTPEAVARDEMEHGSSLFRQNKYAEAKDEFVKLQSLTPDDARVWYYSALANGLATGDWKGETERWVSAGMAREKAGKPDRIQIDAAFSDLTIANGKDWLAYFRNLARKAGQSQ